MTNLTVKPEGEGKFTFDKTGAPTFTSDSPVSITPKLPLGDIRVNVLELVEVSLTEENGVRVFTGKYGDGGTVHVSLDFNVGKLHTNGQELTSVITDSDDGTHSVLTYLPRSRNVGPGATPPEGTSASDA